MLLDLYLVRCQRTALWAVLPLALLTAFAVEAFGRVPFRQSSVNQLFALLPLAAVLASLAVSLVANASDLLQRCIVIAAAVLTMTAFNVAPLDLDLFPRDALMCLLLTGALIGSWSAAAVLIPGRPTPSGRLAWWRLALVVVLLAVLPAASASWIDMFWGPVAVLTFAGPVAFVLASARRGGPARPVASAAVLGAIVGLAMDSRGAAGAALWATELPVLFALGGAAVHVASRARALTAVRTLDGEPVRLPRIGGPTWPARFRAAVRFGLPAAAAAALGVWAFVARAKCRTSWEPSVEATASVAQLGSIVPFITTAPPVAAGMPAPPPLVARPLSETEAARNAGIERLFEHSRMVNFNFDDWDPLPREADTDSDGRREFVDPWGNPLVHFDKSDYEASANGVVHVRGDGTEVRAAPLTDPKAGGWFHPTSLQLFSMGPDGLPNTTDDVVFGR